MQKWTQAGMLGIASHAKKHNATTTTTTEEKPKTLRLVNKVRKDW